MNKKTAFVLPILAVAMFALPHAATAAFTFTQVSQNGNGRAYTSPNASPAYWEDYSVGVFSTSKDGMTSGSIGYDWKVACNDAIARSGLSDTVDTYCVYDAKEWTPEIGSSFYGSGGATTGCTDPNGCPGDPPARGYGTWPPGTSYGFREIKVSIYQAQLQNRSLSDVLVTIDNYNTALFMYQYFDGPQPNDPGYSDACELSHYTKKGTIIQTINAVGPEAACTVFKHTGIAPIKPTATLTAVPPSVVAGNAAALTSTCTNATTAYIDQGIGTVSAIVPQTTSSGALAASKTYTLTCTGSGGTAVATATVNVTAALSATCYATPNPTTTGTQVVWKAYPKGGTGSYSYVWTGTDGLTGTTVSVPKTYAAAGAKNATVTITSGTQTINPQCTVLTINQGAQPDLTAETPEDITIALGQSVTLTGTIRNQGPVSTGVPFPAMIRIKPQGAQESTVQLFSGSSARGIPNGFPANYGEDVSAPYTPDAAKTYQYRICADDDESWHGTVTESDETNNCSGYGTITVSGSKPDLTASNTTASKVVGLAATITTLISNTGEGSTGSGFTDLFQYATDANGSNAKPLGTVANSSRAPGSSNSAHIDATFPSAGTWYVRACADKNAAGDPGVITESDEGNNCSPTWTPITVSVSLSCSVNKTTADAGETVTYTANGGARPYKWTNGEGNVLGATGSTATRTFRTADAGKSFSMKVDSTGFATGNCPVVTVNGGAQACTNPSVDITADPTRVQQGDTSTLTYTASGVNGPCTITGTNSDTWTLTANSCTVPNGTKTTSALTTQTTYTLDCNGTKDTVIINVVPTVIET